MIHIPTVFEKIVQKVSANAPPVYFDYGNEIEVMRNMAMKDNSISHRDRKYPLIWLVMDFAERYGDIDEYEYCQLANIQFVIAVNTKATYTVRERMERSFKPKLYPIYAEFLRQLSESGYFSNADSLEHEKIDRPYWGRLDGNGNGTANLFNDTVDAIQLKIPRLNVNDICGEFAAL